MRRRPKPLEMAKKRPILKRLHMVQYVILFKYPIIGFHFEMSLYKETHN